MRSLWSWYERHYRLNVTVAAGLFALQLAHLYWLTSDVVLPRLAAVSFFPDIPLLKYLIIAVDYTEIPALISASLLYLNDLRQRSSLRPISLLLLTNAQWVHLLWLTDEFVVRHLFHHVGASALPVWLAWTALAIDYLELPIIADTVARTIRSYKTPAWGAD